MWPQLRQKGGKAQEVVSLCSIGGVYWKKGLNFNVTETTPTGASFNSFVYSLFSFIHPTSFSTFQNSQNHIPVVHTSSVERHGAVVAQREAAGQRGDQVKGLWQPLPRQLPGLDNRSVTGLKGLLLETGWANG